MGTLFSTAVVISPAHHGRVSVILLSNTTIFLTEQRTVSNRLSRSNKWSASMNVSLGHLDCFRKWSCRARARAPASALEWQTKKAKAGLGKRPRTSIHDIESSRATRRVTTMAAATTSMLRVLSGTAVSRPPWRRSRSRNVHMDDSKRFRHWMRQGCTKLPKTMCADRSDATNTSWPGPSSCTNTGADIRKRLRVRSTSP
mmetsp:Transcript_73138/g.207426  ORF Transcript_73138/g.207426 Transcript_73138/m.207426 type:complete len:200 (+) Transcript_73138:326-925(+)